MAIHRKHETMILPADNFAHCELGAKSFVGKIIVLFVTARMLVSDGTELDDAAVDH